MVGQRMPTRVWLAVVNVWSERTRNLEVFLQKTDGIRAMIREHILVSALCMSWLIGILGLFKESVRLQFLSIFVLCFIWVGFITRPVVMVALIATQVLIAITYLRRAWKRIAKADIHECQGGAGRRP